VKGSHRTRVSGDCGTSEQVLRFDEFTGRLEVVPEPSTWGMLLAGGAAAGISALRRRRQKMLGM